MAISSAGSRTALANRTAQGTEDVNFTLPNNTDHIILGCGVEDTDGHRLQVGDVIDLQFRTGADAFASVGAATVVRDGNTNLVDNNALTSGERLSTGLLGSYINGREIETNTATQSAEVRDDTTESQWSLDFGSAAASTTYDFRVRWGTKDGDMFQAYISITTAAAPAGSTALPGVGTLTLAGKIPVVVRTDNHVQIPPVGTAILSGKVPVVTVSDNHIVLPGTGSLAVAGLVPSVIIGTTIDVPVGSLTLEGFPPPSVLQPSEFGLKLTGLVPTVDVTAGIDHTALPGTGTLIVAGEIPTATTTQNQVIAVPVGTLTATGQTPTADIDHVISVPVGSLTATGLTPTATTTQNQVISIPVGTLVLTGLAPVVVVSLTVSPSLGALVLTGQIPTLVLIDNHIRAPPVGTAVLTGQVPALLTGDNHIAQPGTGTLVVTSLIPTLVQEENHAISIPLGTLTLSGKVPAVLTGDEVIAQPATGSLVLSGKIPTATTTDNHIALPGVGSLSLSGSISTVRVGVDIAVPAGSLTLTGFAPPTVLQPSDFGLKLTGFIPTISVGQNPVVTPATGSLSITGDSPALEIVITNAESSLFLEGFAPTVTVTPNIFLKIPVGSLTLTGFEPLPVIPQGSVGVQPGLGQLNLNGFSPTVYLSKYFPRNGTIALLGFEPTVIVSVPVVEVGPPTTGWKFLMEFDTFRKKRDEEEEKRKKALEAIKELEATDREIGELLQQQIAAELRQQQIKELERIIAQNATKQDLIDAKAHNVAKAFARAALQKNFSAIEALEREMDRKIEEDEFLMLAMVILD